MTAAEARRVARAFAQALKEDPDLAYRMTVAHVAGRATEFAEMFERFSAGTDRGHSSAAEERDAQRRAVRDAVWSWMDRVYERCPRLEHGEVMELKVIADQSGYADPGGSNKRDEFELFSFRIETTTTEGEF